MLYALCIRVSDCQVWSGVNLLTRTTAKEALLKLCHLELLRRSVPIVEIPSGKREYTAFDVFIVTNEYLKKRVEWTCVFWIAVKGRSRSTSLLDFLHISNKRFIWCSLLRRMLKKQQRSDFVGK